MNAFAMVADELTSPFTRVGSQVQSLPRPPLNPVISKAFSGFWPWSELPEHAEQRANKRLISGFAGTNSVQARLTQEAQ